MDSIWERIRTHAATGPTRPAVTGAATVDRGALVTLVERTSARLARLCAPGDVVALPATPTLPALAALLAALRCAVVFVPVDETAPAARRELLMRDAGARAVVRVDPNMPDGIAVELVSTGTPLPGTAYVMYTSGSTGRPKGVVVSEHSLLTRLDAYVAAPGMREGASFLAMAALTFDPSLVELLLPLLVGGPVVLAPPGLRRDPAAFGDFIATHRPDAVQGTPTFWRSVLDAGWPGLPDAMLWTGGEALTERLASDLLPRCRELWNVYGPTETTIWATGARITDPAAVSLGAPLSGRCDLVRDRVVVREPGVEGEIVISGDCVALGYLGDTPESARFTTVPGIPGRAYLSGDRARHRPDGALEFLGRQDTQVKLRGHRIELGEIEAVLGTHPRVTDAVVLVLWRGTEDERLAAAVSTTRPQTERALRGWLAERLPAHMVPAQVLVRPTLPCTITGKVDRVALRAELGA